MKIRSLHGWDVNYAGAVAIQNSLRQKVKIPSRPVVPARATNAQLSKRFPLVAGADISYDKGSDKLFGAVVVLRLPSLELVEQQTVTGRATFPYIPGLLSFRELPVLLPAFERLQHAPDVVLVDGQGLAHPRRLGIACHLGLLLNTPTVGCAKSRLTGAYLEPAPRRGAWSRLVDEKDKTEIIGRVLRTRDGVKPLFISIGHNIDLETAIKLALLCAPKYRVTEPTRRAHALVNQLRRQSHQG